MILLALQAFADDGARAWETLYDARLVEAVDGTPEVAVLYYEELLQDMKPEDPMAGEAWYWLGRARWELGDPEGATAALRQAARDPRQRAAATGLLARIDLAVRAVRTLPWAASFEGSTGGFIRAGETAAKGALEIRPVDDDDPALAWNTRIEAGTTDRLLLALEPGLALHTIAFRVRATTVAADLRVAVADGAGGRYVAPALTVPTGDWLLVELPLSGFRAEADGARPTGVRLLELEDLTGLRGKDLGPNTLLVDEVSLR